MMLILFVALIVSKTKICICHNECTLLCNQTTFNGTFNPQFNNFLQTYIEKDKDIELMFYSNEIDSKFDLELLPFKGLNLSISTLFDSYPVKISFIIDEFSTKQIIVNPNKQLVFHQIDPIQNKDQILQYLNSPDLLSTNNIKDFNNDNYSKIKSKFNSNQILFKNKSKLIKEQPNKTVLDDSDGLINVSCFNFEYSTGWSIGFNNDANQGSYSTESEAEAWFKFNGTRVHVNIYREQKNAYLEVYLDNILVLPSTSCRSPNSNYFNDIIFTSNYLPFGEHLIKIKAKSQSVVISSFFVDPLPNYGGYKLGFNDFIQLGGKWTSIFNKRLIFSSNDDGASGIFKFYGTRFWITGIQDCNHGAFQIVIDDKEPINIDATYSSNEPGACEKSADSGPNLLYQSNVLDLTNHTVKIQKTTQEVSLVNFLYTTQPYNAIVIPAKEMNLHGSWEKNSIGYSTIKEGSTAEITEYFNKFWVLGFKEKNNALVSIYYDDVLKDSFDTYQINEELFGNVLLYQSEEEYRNNYKVKIENSGFASELSNEKSLHINYCYYLNEKTIKIEGSTDTIGVNDMNNRSGTWNIENNKLCSETKGSTVTFRITYSQFWIKGSIDPNYGNIEIIIDNQEHIFVSLYHEKHEDNIVYYESPRYSYNKIHTIVIINHDDLPINIQEIQYRELCNYERNTYKNLDGLINITCDKLILEGDNWQRCQNTRWGEPGTYTDSAGKASYKFNGTRIHILSRLEKNKRTDIIIRVDNKDVANLEYLNTEETDFKVIYSSEYLPFGEHSIEIENKWKENEVRNFFIRSFFIDPLPKVGGYKLQYDDILDKSNNWNNVNEADTPYYYTTEPTAYLTYKFHGTRFWLTGIRKLNFKTFKLIIDEGTPINIDITINEKNIPGLNVSYSLRFHENTGYLLYESDVLKLKDHTVRIENVESNEIYINNFLYSTQPYNAICIPSDQIQFDEHWIKSDEGYSSSIEGAIAETTNYFNHFWIIGNKEQNHANMNIYYNNNKQLNINPNELETTLSNHILLYELKDIPLDYYHFRIERINDNTNNAEQILHINYCYYLNEKTIKIEGSTDTIGVNDMNDRSGTWNIENNKLCSETKGSTVTFRITYSQFWIKGSIDPNYGNIEIIIDNQEHIFVSLYHEKHEDNIVYYESPRYSYNKIHTIVIINHDDLPINIQEIQYRELCNYERNTYKNLDGLINITCDKLILEGDNWQRCQNTRWGEPGTYTDSAGKASYKFNGTRIHILSRLEKNKRTDIIIRVDNKDVANLEYLNTEETDFKVIYSSEYLPFGEHSIEIENKWKENEVRNFFIRSFFIDPLPKVGGYKLQYDDILDKSNNWNIVNEADTPYYYTTEPTAYLTYKFHGTRFWLTGIRKLNFKTFKLIIDEGTPINIDITINEKNIPGLNVSYSLRFHENTGYLLYESDVLKLKDHTVRIENVESNEIYINNFLYSTQPYNAICIPSDQIQFDEHWIKSDEGYSSSIEGAIAETTNYFNHFWIIGNKEQNHANMNIYYNNNKQLNINPNELETTLSNHILLYELKDIPLDYYHFRIERINDNTNNAEQILHINYCYYLNEKTIKIEGSTDTIGVNDMSDRSGSWNIENNKLCSETKGSTVTFRITYSQFWIKGSIDPNYGNIEIIIDNQEHIFVSLYHEKHEDNIVYYESPRYSYNKIHTIVIINHDDLPINIQEIQYRELCNYERNTYKNLDGLINITCDKLILEGDNWQRCQNTRWGEPGTYTDSAGKASYKFNGTRIHILSRLEKNKRTDIIIRVDNKDVANLEYLNTEETDFKVIYSSEYLPFGEHSIEIENKWKENEVRNFFIRSFFIDPLPKVGGYKLQYDDILDKSNNWNNVNEADTPYYYTTEPTAYLTYKFHGTRFWLTGIRKLNFKTFKLIIDEGTPINIDITINEKNIPGLNVSYSLRFHENTGYLLYESDVLKLKDHTVRIENVESNEIYINNFLYSTQPYNAICIPSDQIQFDEHWIKSDEGYSSSIEGAIAETTNYFNHFWIIGNKEQNHANMNIYYNNNKQLNINPNELETTLSNHILLYELKDIPLDNYHFRIERINDNTNNAEQILHINYCYYLNDDIISINQKVSTIESSRIHNREGTWITYINNENSQSIYSKDENSSIKVHYLGSKFWIVGSTGPNFGLIDINVDGRDLGRVSLYQERDQNNTIYYVSPNDVFYGQHTITIYNRQNKSINIEKICYDSFVPTFIFSESQHFSISDYFSNSKHFSKSNDFTYTTDFTKSNDFTYTTNFTKSNDFTRTNDFTKSSYFTKSNDFTKTSGFTKTDGFTQSTYFTQSSDFSQSTHFTKSSGFIKTSDFTKSNEFTKTDGFKETSHFSKTVDFTKSSDFSQSTYFTKSSGFIKTSDFTKSNEFTKTDGFKETSHFSKTVDFTKTSGFSQSTYFTKSNSFSQSLTYSDVFTHHFSKSNDFTKSKGFESSLFFTKSKAFESTLFFSKSNEFSESFTFSMSPTLEIKEPKCILYEDGEEKLLNECSISISESNNALIKVILTNFTHINKDIINGTAIHIENCGLDCNRTLFDDCTTSEGCGGAIYIRNILDIYHNITFEDLIFINCKAICGGAVFIHSEAEREILFKNCTFISNEATNKKSSSFNLFGGSAIYLSTLDANIVNCSFNENFGKGGCVKIEPISNKNDRINQLELNKNPIRIYGCNFENTIKSESSIYNENDDNIIEIVDCNFKGKLKKGSHYIDGKTIDNNNLQIKNCKFEYDSKIAIDSKLKENNLISRNYVHKWSIGFNCAFVLFSVFALITIIIIKMHIESGNRNELLNSENISDNLIKNNQESI